MHPTSTRVFPSQPSPPPLEEIPVRVKQWLHTLRTIHPSHNGTYSIERLQALSKYCSEASLLRVVTVNIVLPLPAFFVAILLEFVPLQDPLDGWKANIGAWTRLGFVAFFIALGLIIQTNEMVPASKLTKTKTLLVPVAASTAQVMISCWIASAWVYPVPFLSVASCPIFACILIVLFVSAIGRETFRQNPMLGRQLRKQLGIIMIQSSLCCIYPAFSAIYFRLEPLEQTALVLVLPVIKLVMQSATAYLARNVEDCVPGIIVFSVEVFNALYLTKCMQNAKSSATYLVIMGFDVIKSIVAFRDMKQQLAEAHRLQTQFDSTELTFLHAVLSACNEPGVVHQGQASFMRKNDSVLLRTFRSVERNERLKPDLCKSPLCDAETGEPKVLLTEFTSSAVSLADKHAFAYRSLKILFQCEYHLLAEYVECIIPISYAVYVTILCHLPSAKYYPETREMTPAQIETMALNILIYAWLEVLSLIALHFALKRRFGFSPAYLLAFVLENQFIEIQARLIVWFTYLLQLTLVHFGLDFSLQFEWIHSQP